LQPLLRCPVFDTPYQKLQLQLEEFPVQAAEQKIVFWQNLSPTLQLLPENCVVYRLLPLLKANIQTISQSDSMRTQDMYRREGTLLAWSLSLVRCVDRKGSFSPRSVDVFWENSSINDATLVFHCRSIFGGQDQSRNW
jgi:hypothetical protein